MIFRDDGNSNSTVFLEEYAWNPETFTDRDLEDYQKVLREQSIGAIADYPYGSEVLDDLLSPDGGKEVDITSWLAPQMPQYLVG
jgi:hypothetical protein